MAKRLKVIVTVRGGNVTAIHASSEIDAEFSVLDYDLIETGNLIQATDKERREIEALEGEIENKQLVEVY